MEAQTPTTGNFKFSIQNLRRPNLIWARSEILRITSGSDNRKGLHLEVIIGGLRQADIRLI
jgi:hypothetical protein